MREEGSVRERRGSVRGRRRVFEGERGVMGGGWGGSGKIQMICVSSPFAPKMKTNVKDS